MKTLGIDPGKSGALCALDNRRNGDSWFTSDIRDVPVYKTKRLHGKWIKTEIDYEALFVTVADMGKGVDLAVLEKAQAFPGQGSVSTFSFGEVYGAIKMALLANSIPMIEVRPNLWKRKFELTDDKNESVRRATLLVKGTEPIIGRNHNRAEALLLAYLGLTTIANFPDMKNAADFINMTYNREGDT